MTAKFARGKLLTLLIVLSLIGSFLLCVACGSSSSTVAFSDATATSVAYFASATPDSTARQQEATAIAETSPNPSTSVPNGPIRTPGGRVGLPAQVKFPFQQTFLAGLPVTAYIPPASPTQTVQIMFALHGMYDHGDRFATSVLPFAIKNHLLLLAPTFSYNRNYKDPNVIVSEDITLTAKLNRMIGAAANYAHEKVGKRVLLYGFSRGAQLAHHFAYFYPTQVAAIAVLSGGAYTLPYTIFNNQPLLFPFGVSDLSHYIGTPFDQVDFIKIPFDVQVGALDTDPTQVSPNYSPYTGVNRLQRGQNFYHALRQIGVHAEFNAIPNTRHADNAGQVAALEQFFQNLLAS